LYPTAPSHHALSPLAGAVSAILCTSRAICLRHPTHPRRLTTRITQWSLLTHATHAPASRSSRAVSLSRV
jgi:hypothetical protein